MDRISKRCTMNAPTMMLKGNGSLLRRAGWLLCFVISQRFPEKETRWAELISGIIVSGTHALAHSGTFSRDWSMASSYHSIFAAGSIKLIKQLFIMHGTLCSITDG
ncbi:hypothetical protein CB1_001428110 [Camelus ferus]|nr:hypothetical protein CB1_001428110 [Camelus ferus]